MPQNSSRAQRLRHPYQMEEQKLADSLADQCNPITITWAKATIVRKGDIVRSYRNGVMVYDSTSNRQKFDTR